MNHNTEKNYYECLAKNILEMFLPDQYSDLLLVDRPDLLSPKGIGIEVTRSMFDGTSPDHSFYLKYLMKKNIQDVDPQRIKNFEKSGNKLLIVDDVIYGYSVAPRWYSIKEIKDAYTKKKERLSTYNLTIPINLFIFSPTFNDYDIDDIEEFLEWIYNNKSGEKDYSNVYIYQENVMYICDVVMKNVDTLILDKEKVDLCCKKAKEYAQNEK